MKSFSSESSVRSAIADNTEGSGLYMLPNLNKYSGKPCEMAAAKERMREGPFAVVAVAAEGRNPGMAAGAIQSLIVKILAACIVTWLLLQTTYATDVTKAVKFITVVGIVIAIAATLPYSIWFAFPGSFVIGSLFEIVFGWFFAGLAISRVIKR